MLIMRANLTLGHLSLLIFRFNCRNSSTLYLWNIQKNKRTMNVISIYTFLLFISTFVPEGLSTESLRQRTSQLTGRKEPMALPPMKPKCTKNNSNFCNKIENYPQEMLDDLLRQLPNYRLFFRHDQLVNTSLTHRFDDSLIRRPLCETHERVIYPQAGMTQEREWSVIINHAKYRQGVRVEECIKPELPCSIDVSFSSEKRHKCVQKYAYRQLLSLDSTGKVVKELFRLPSCCMCMLYKKGD